MDFAIDFVSNNIVWFIVGGVVILMTIIGYLADKTDFARKKYRDKMLAKESEKNEKKKNKKEKQEEEVVEAKIEEEQVNPVVEEQNKQSLEALYNPVMEEPSNEVQTSDIPEELFAPINNNSVDNDAEQIDASVTPDMPEVNASEVPGDIVNNDFAPVQGIEELSVPDMEQATNGETLEEAPLQNDINVEQVPPMDFQVEAPAVNEDVLPQVEQSESLTESSEEQSFDMTIDDQFNKIFPGDPVVIGDEQKTGEEVKDTLEPQEVAPEQEVEDVWKF